MAMATGVRLGPEDLAQYADTLRQPQLRALGLRRDQRIRWHRSTKKVLGRSGLAGEIGPNVHRELRESPFTQTPASDPPLKLGSHPTRGLASADRSARTLLCPNRIRL